VLAYKITIYTPAKSYALYTTQLDQTVAATYRHHEGRAMFQVSVVPVSEYHAWHARQTA
jgi:hypothetical protein